MKKKELLEEIGSEKETVTENEAKEISTEESERVKKMAESQLREINALNPAIRNLGDIMQMETAETFREYVGKGLSFVEAYKLANFEAIKADELMKGKREAYNLMRSKGHLQPTVSRGKGAVTVPKDEMDMYKQLNPGMTEADILKHYNAYKKR